MGLFDKKRRPGDDDDDDVSAGSRVMPPPPAKQPPPPPLASELPKPAAHVDAAMPKVAGSVPHGDPAFTIEEAVMLMRTLPNRNIDLVMQVVKKTLESVKVDVPRIIEGAQKKEQVIEERVATLKKEIEKLEGQIAAAKKEIAGLEADQREVSTVKERLILAQKVEGEVTSDRPGAQVAAGPAVGASSVAPAASQVAPGAPAASQVAPGAPRPPASASSAVPAVPAGPPPPPKIP